MNKTILIIDKEMNDYNTLKERLEKSGYIVYTSTDCHEGINLAIKQNPDLIIYNFYLFLLSEKDLFEKNPDLRCLPLL